MLFRNNSTEPFTRPESQLANAEASLDDELFNGKVALVEAGE